MNGLTEHVRENPPTVNTVIAYLRYSGKALLASSTSDYETTDAIRLLTFADVLEAAHDERRVAHDRTQADTYSS